MENRRDDYRIGTYQGFAEDLAEQFERGENVDAGNLEYLRDFPDNHEPYDWLMGRIADMYGVVPLDQVHESTCASALRNDPRPLGRIAQA